ncbi:MAG: hypothetical protein ABIR30_14280 [Chitinophagaceae bacterium]
MKHKFLLCAILSLFIVSGTTAQVNATTKQLTKADVTVFNNTEKDYQQLQKELQQLEEQKKQLIILMKAYNDQQKTVGVKMEKLERSYDGMGASGGGQDQLLNATKQMQETQMSFNLQYLQLQSQMQHENRSYTAVSNIMKTKHDTVKNSISNVR